MRRAIVGAVFLMAMLAAVPATAETLPLPPSLIDIQSVEGEKLLFESEARAAYFPLTVNFVTQQTQSYCGVASIVMVLNAMGLPAPTPPEYAPYKTFTQDDFLTDATDKVLDRTVLLKQGMTLDQLGGLLGTQPVRADVVHAADTTLDAFRAKAREYLATKGRFVIVNYLRMKIGQEKFGHISPLAAYDADTDRFLILDVARYKYPPVWVSAAGLYDAMNTPDADNDNKTRGFVLIARRDG